GDRMQPVRGPVGVEEVAREVGDGLRLGAVAMDRQDVDLVASGQAEQDERLERSRGLPAAPVSDDDAGPDGQLARDDDDGPRPGAQDVGEGRVRGTLPLETEVGLGAQDARVAAVRLAQDALRRIADLPENVRLHTRRRASRAKDLEKLRDLPMGYRHPRV